VVPRDDMLVGGVGFGGVTVSAFWAIAVSLVVG
jgi:hypothetical protein